MRRMGLAGAILMGAVFGAAGGATAAQSVALCIPTGEGRSVMTPKAGGCPSGYALADLGSERSEGTEQGETGTGLRRTELKTLESILPHITYIARGVGGKPTIQFSGLNVQIVNGGGETASVNGVGNLVLGYDENGNKHPQTGSHNLIFGFEQTFTSYGGLLAGAENLATAPFVSVLGGPFNAASGEFASASGGAFNTASGAYSTVAGADDIASGNFASVSGGNRNTAEGIEAWIGGGFRNIASGTGSAVFGGRELTAGGAYEAIP